MRGGAVWPLLLVLLVEGLSGDISFRSQCHAGPGQQPATPPCRAPAMHICRKQLLGRIEGGGANGPLSQSVGRRGLVGRGTALNALRGGWGAFGNDPLYETLGLQKNNMPSERVLPPPLPPPRVRLQPCSGHTLMRPFSSELQAEAERRMVDLLVASSGHLEGSAQGSSARLSVEYIQSR